MFDRGVRARQRLLQRGGGRARALQRVLQRAARRTRVLQCVFQVRTDLLEADARDAFEDFRHLRLQVAAAAGEGGNQGRGQRRVECGLGRLGLELERDIRLAGDQVAALELGTQAAVDQVFEEHRIGLGGATQWREEIAPRIAETGREDLGHHLHWKAARAFVVLHRHRAHRADLGAQHLHTCAGCKATHSRRKHHANALGNAIGHGERGLAVVEQHKALAGGRRRRLGGAWRGGKGDPARHQRRDRLGVDVQAGRTHADVDAARIPEAGLRRHQRFIRRFDQHLHIQPVALRVERVAHHPADAGAPVVHRRAHLERAQVGGVQHEPAPGLTAQHEGRHLQACEMGFVLARFAGIAVDVHAREQRAQAADARRADARAHDPELGVAHRHAGGRLVQAHGCDHAAAVRAETHLGDAPDHHFLVAHLGTPRLQPFGIAKRDRDQRAGLQQGAHHQHGAGQQGDQRHDPHQRKAQPIRAHDHRLGERRRAGGAGGGRGGWWWGVDGVTHGLGPCARQGA